MKTLYTDKDYKIVFDYSEGSYDFQDCFGDDNPFKFNFYSREDFTLNELDLNDLYIAILAGREDREELLKNGDIDEDDIEKLKTLEEKYKFLPIGIYEHSCYNFFIDTKYGRDYRQGGVLAIEKDCEIDATELMHEFTTRFNGRMVQYTVLKKHVYKDEDGNELVDWDFEDSCGGFFKEEDCRDYIGDGYGKIIDEVETY